jgi:hypothetical protein
MQEKEWEVLLALFDGCKDRRIFELISILCFKIFDGIEPLIQGNLYFASSEELNDYRNVVQRGFIEIRELLKKYRVI